MKRRKKYGAIDLDDLEAVLEEDRVRRLLKQASGNSLVKQDWQIKTLMDELPISKSVANILQKSKDEGLVAGLKDLKNIVSWTTLRVINIVPKEEAFIFVVKDWNDWNQTYRFLLKEKLFSCVSPEEEQPFFVSLVLAKQKNMSFIPSVLSRPSAPAFG